MTLPALVFNDPVQSSDVTTAAHGEGVTTHEEDQGVTSFIDETPGDIVAFQPIQDSSYLDSYKADSGLDKFLSRPVLIDNRTWTVGGGVGATISPWHLYFTNSVIKNKLQNYAFISCELHIKVMINASPFYYGLAGLFYEPLPNTNPAPIIDYASEIERIPLSQRPHIWLYPQNNQGGEMVLPFLYPKNWLNLTLASDFTNMGSLRLYEYADLLNANGVAGTDCDIKIYAWAENVRVCGPTYAAALQSRNTSKVKTHQSQRGGTDEYIHQGPVSKVASAIARATGAVSELPIIGSALSTVSTVAGGIADVASIFGFTNYPNIETVNAFKNLPFHAMSSADISTPLDKLTLDPRNELIVNGEVAGAANADELNIAALCARESFIYSVNWGASNVMDDLLFSTSVTPELSALDGVGPTYPVVMTPMCMVARNFENWRGNIVFRFRFICSKYHRGRVRITWDPIADLDAQTDTKTSNYNRIVDINEEPDVRIKIPYLALTSYLRCTHNIGQVFGSASGAPDPIYENGQLTMRVFTQQTSPSSSADIKVIVSAYGEDMEFANPAYMHEELTYYELQSQDEIVEFNEAGISVPLFQDSEASPDINHIYNGEHITSLSQLFRRFSLSKSYFFPANSTDRVTIMEPRTSRLPLYSGWDPNGIDYASKVITPGTTAPYNFVHTIPLNIVGACFVAYRGSINWKFNAGAPVALGSFKVMRWPDTITAANYRQESDIGNGTDTSYANYQYMNATRPGSSGQSLVNQLTQTGLCVVSPQYGVTRFRSPSPLSRTLGIAFDGSDIDNLEISLENMPAAGLLNDKYLKIDSYCGTGADFALHYFLNVPTMHYSPTVPVGSDA